MENIFNTDMSSSMGSNSESDSDQREARSCLVVSISHNYNLMLVFSKREFVEDISMLFNQTYIGIFYYGTRAI